MFTESFNRVVIFIVSISIVFTQVIPAGWSDVVAGTDPNQGVLVPVKQYDPNQADNNSKVQPDPKTQEDKNLSSSTDFLSDSPLSKTDSDNEADQFAAINKSGVFSLGDGKSLTYDAETRTGIIEYGTVKEHISDVTFVILKNGDKKDAPAGRTQAGTYQITTTKAGETKTTPVGVYGILTDVVVDGRSLVKTVRTWGEDNEPDILKSRKIVRNADGTYTVYQAMEWAGDRFEDTWHFVIGDGNTAGDRVILNRYYRKEERNAINIYTVNKISYDESVPPEKRNILDLSNAGYAYYPARPGFPHILYLDDVGGSFGNVNFVTGEITGAGSLDDFITKVESFQPKPPFNRNTDLDYLAKALKKLATDPAQKAIQQALDAFNTRHQAEMSGPFFAKAVTIGFVRDVQETVKSVKEQLLILARRFRIKDQDKLMGELDQVFRTHLVLVLDGYVEHKDLLIGTTSYYPTDAAIQTRLEYLKPIIEERRTEIPALEYLKLMVAKRGASLSDNPWFEIPRDSVHYSALTRMFGPSPIAVFETYNFDEWIRIRREQLAVLSAEREALERVAYQLGPDDFMKSLYEHVRNVTYGQPDNDVTVDDLKQALRMSAMAMLRYRPDFAAEQGRLEQAVDAALNRIFAGLPALDEYFDSRRIVPSLLSSIGAFDLLSPAANRELAARFFPELALLLEMDGVSESSLATVFPRDDDRNGFKEMSIENFNRYLDGTLHAYETMRVIVSRIVAEKRDRMNSHSVNGLQLVHESDWLAVRNLLEEGKHEIEASLRKVLEEAKRHITDSGLKVPADFEWKLLEQVNTNFQNLVNHFDYILRFFRFVTFDIELDGEKQTVQVDIQHLSSYFTSQVDGSNGLAALPRVNEFVERGLLNLKNFERENEKASHRRIELGEFAIGVEIAKPARDSVLSSGQGYYDFLISVARILIDQAGQEGRPALLTQMSKGRLQINIGEYRRLMLTNDTIEKKIYLINALVDKNVREIREILRSVSKPLYLWLIHALEGRGTEVREKIIVDLEKFIKEEGISHSLVLSEIERRANEIFQRLVNTIENEIDSSEFKIEVDGKEVVMTMGELQPIIDDELIKVSVGGGRINSFLLRLNITEADLKGLETEFAYQLWRQVQLGGPSLQQPFDRDAVLSRRGLRDLVADRLFGRYLKEDPAIIGPVPDERGFYKVSFDSFRMRLTRGTVRQGDLLSKIMKAARETVRQAQAVLEIIRQRIQRDGAAVEDFDAIENLLKDTRNGILNSVLAELASAGLKLEDLYSYERGRIEWQIRVDYPLSYVDFFNQAERLIQATPIVKLTVGNVQVEVEWKQLVDMIPPWIDLNRFIGIAARQEVLAGKETGNVYQYQAIFSLASAPAPDANGYSQRGLRHIVFDLLRAYGTEAVGKDTNQNGLPETNITYFRKAIFGYFIILNREMAFSQAEVARATREILELGIGSGLVRVELFQKLETILRGTRDRITNHLIEGVRYLDREFVLDIESKVGRPFALLVAESDQFFGIKDVIFDARLNGKRIEVKIPVQQLVNILIEEAERVLGHKIEGIYDVLKLMAVTYDMVQGKDTLAQYLMKRQVFTPEPNNSTVVRVKQKFSPLGYRDLVIDIVQRLIERFGSKVVAGPGRDGTYSVKQSAFRHLLNSQENRASLKGEIAGKIDETLNKIREAIGGHENTVKKVSLDALKKVNKIVSNTGIRDLIRKVRDYMVGKEDDTEFLEEIKQFVSESYQKIIDFEKMLYTKTLTTVIDKATADGIRKQEVEFKLSELYQVIAGLSRDIDGGTDFKDLLNLAGIDAYDLQNLVSEDNFTAVRRLNLGDLTIEKLYDPTEDFDTKVLFLDNLDVVADGNRFAQTAKMSLSDASVMMSVDSAISIGMGSYRGSYYSWKPGPSVPKGSPSMLAQAELVSRLIQKFYPSVVKNEGVSMAMFYKELNRGDAERVNEFVERSVKEGVRQIGAVRGVNENSLTWEAFQKLVKTAYGTKQVIEDYLKIYNSDRFDYSERDEIDSFANKAYTDDILKLADFRLGIDPQTGRHYKDIILTLRDGNQSYPVKMNADELLQIIRKAIDLGKAGRVDNILDRFDFEIASQFNDNRKITIGEGYAAYGGGHQIFEDINVSYAVVDSFEIKEISRVNRGDLIDLSYPIEREVNIYKSRARSSALYSLSVVGQVEFLNQIVSEIFSESGNFLLNRTRGSVYEIKEDSFRKALDQERKHYAKGAVVYAEMAMVSALDSREVVQKHAENLKPQIDYLEKDATRSNQRIFSKPEKRPLTDTRKDNRRETKKKEKSEVRNSFARNLRIKKISIHPEFQAVETLKKIKEQTPLMAAMGKDPYMRPAVSFLRDYRDEDTRSIRTEVPARKSVKNDASFEKFITKILKIASTVNFGISKTISSLLVKRAAVSE